MSLSFVTARVGRRVARLPLPPLPFNELYIRVAGKRPDGTVPS